MRNGQGVNSARQHTKKSKLSAQRRNRVELRMAVRGRTASQQLGTVRDICVASNNSSVRMRRHFMRSPSKAGQLRLRKLRMAVQACVVHHAAAPAEAEAAAVATGRMKTVTTNRLVLPCMAKAEKGFGYSKPRPVKQSFASTRDRMLWMRGVKPRQTSSVRSNPSEQNRGLSVMLQPRAVEAELSMLHPSIRCCNQRTRNRRLGSHRLQWQTSTQKKVHANECFVRRESGRTRSDGRTRNN